MSTFLSSEKCQRSKAQRNVKVQKLGEMSTLLSSEKCQSSKGSQRNTEMVKSQRNGQSSQRISQSKAKKGPTLEKRPSYERNRKANRLTDTDKLPDKRP